MSEPASTGTTTSIGTLSTSPRGRCKKGLRPLWQTRRQLQHEYDRMGTISEITKSGYEETRAALRDLIKTNRKTTKLGRQRTELLKEIAKSENTPFPSTKRNFIQLRKADGVSRSGRPTKTSEITKLWDESNASKRKHWSSEKWSELQQTFRTEREKALSTNKTLREDIEILESMARTSHSMTNSDPRSKSGSSSPERDEQGERWLGRLRDLRLTKRARWGAKQSKASDSDTPSIGTASSRSSSDKETLPEGRSSLSV
ncbi:uncharacterized protein I206_101292 [Kwoniella pini CBS 10737]|uniref:Uncharacterized protein n=1 Tax=Kwoniella pini CBS 10737 TaxID=1296096 RepID=A0A1B9IAT9_9TREE|nr:uncharacterized protein I206_00031 [Kwoniella pini CBS 10737]OCF52735.1 hypothetical protein I206_00031 [Kwoniella pini CBS 10737]